MSIASVVTRGFFGNIIPSRGYIAGSPAPTPTPTPTPTPSPGGAADKRKQYLEWQRKQKKRNVTLLEKNKQKYAIFPEKSEPQEKIVNLTDKSAIIEKTAEMPLHISEVAKNSVIQSIASLTAQKRSKLEVLEHNKLVSILDELREQDDEEAILLMV